MKTEEARNKILKCLGNLGYIIDDEENDIDISEFIVDSVEFVEFLVELEDEFETNIPDSLLGIEILKSLNGLANMMCEISD